jgi:maleate cis-trans isomerase
MKFGCIAPSVVQLPWDLHALIPQGVQALTVTLNVRNGQPGEQERAISNMQRAADVLIDEGAQSIVVMGVPVAARRGYAADRTALDALTAARGAIPIISSLAASALALEHLGAKHPLFITQYNDEVNAAMVGYCREMGLNVGGIVGLGATNAAMVNALSVSDYEDLTRRALDKHPKTDGIFLSARGSLLALTRKLTAAFRLPAIEQIEASVWWSLAQLGAAPSAGAGRLFPPDFVAQDGSVVA